MTELHSFSVPLKIKVTQNGTVVFERTFKNGPVTFGRTTKNDVTLEFEFVSRNHCHLFEDNGKFYLEDLKSSNGIRVHDHKVSKIEVTDVFEFSIVSLQITIEKLAEEVTQIMPEGGKKMMPTLSNAAPGIVPAPPTVKSLEVEPLRIERHQQTEQPQQSSPAQPPSPLPPMGVTQRPQEQEERKEKPKAPKQKQRHYKPVLNKDFSQDLLGYHPASRQARAKKMEAVVLWHDQVYDVREFNQNDRIVAGSGPLSNLPLPLQQDWALAKIEKDGAQCYIPANKDATLIRDGKTLAMGDLLAKQILKQKTIGYTMKLTQDEVLKVEMGSALAIVFRYVPAARELTKATMTEPETALKQALISSFVLHFFLAFMMILSAPNLDDVPKIKNVSARYAKLLMEKPKPKPTPKPPEKKVAEKKPEPKKQEVVKAKKVPMKLPKVLAKVNKFPMEVKHPVPKAPPPKKVEDLGAIGALGAISKSAPTNQVTSININPNAGGMTTTKINTGGIAGALPSANGTLIAAGAASRVKTKGMGYGTGTGYGVQGLKGVAGSRGVAGAIVGQPKLASLAKEEGLSRAQVMAVVQKYLGEIQHCYERNLLATPNLAGRMEFEWDISAGGEVTGVRVKRSTVAGGDNLGECVKGIFAGMKFPRATNGATTTPNIGFPFGRL